MLDASGRPLIGSDGQPIVAPPGVARVAGQQLNDATANPDAVKQALANQPATPLIPGDRPTTFQATGDVGLGQQELKLRNAPASSQAFLARAADQNQARVNAIQSVAPADASVDDLPAALAKQQSDLQASGQQVVQQGQAQATAATDALGGQQLGLDGYTAEQQYGRQFRNELQNAADSSKAAASSLYRAVDPDGSLVYGTAPVKSTGQSISAAMPQNAAPMIGEEKAIFDTIQSLPPSQPFGELGALTSRVSAAMRAARQDPAQAQSYARLSQLRSGLANVLQAGVEDKVASDTAAVDAGTMTPEQATMAALNRWAETQRAAAGSEQEIRAGGISGTGTVSLAGGGMANDASLLGTARASGNGPQDNAGIASLPGQTPNIDQAALDRKAAADAAYAQHQSTFGARSPGVGQVLAPGPTQGTYRLPDASVSKTLFAGSNSGGKVQAAIQAGVAPSQIADYAAYDLRRSAQRPDGSLDPAKYGKWLQGNGEALQALNNADPAIGQRFTDAARAAVNLDNLAAKHAEALKAFQSGPARPFLAGSNPADAIGRLLGSDTRLQSAAALKRVIQGNPAAEAAAKQAVVDHIFSRLQSNVLAGNTGTAKLKSDQFQSWINRAAPALHEFFSPQEVQNLVNVGRTLQRDNMSVAGTRVEGGSDTAQKGLLAMTGDTLLGAVKKHGLAALGTILGAVHGGEAGVFIGHQLGRLSGAFQTGGSQQAAALFKEAMLNPQLATPLLERLTPENQSDVGQRLVRALGNLSSVGAAHTVLATQRVMRPTPSSSPRMAAAAQPTGLAGLGR